MGIRLWDAGALAAVLSPFDLGLYTQHTGTLGFDVGDGEERPDVHPNRARLSSRVLLIARIIRLHLAGVI